ncbi:MAG: DUF4382 domain-containing protein [Terracidiphilus sp.]
MSTKGFEKLVRLALIPLTAVVLVASGCTSSLTTTTQSGAGGGSVFVVGTDAPPLAAVVGFPVTITSITANPTSGPPVCLISSCTTGVTADFARFNGLQTLLDDNDVPQGTYDSITITLGTGTIDYLSVPSPLGSAPPTIAPMAASYSPSNSVTIMLANPLVVGPAGGEPVGLRIDFDLAKSIQVSGTPATITGAVNPTFDVRTVTRSDTFAHIDEFIGSVTTLPTTSGTPPAPAEPNSFVITGPHGEAFTINTTSSTEWDGGASLASLNSSSIVAVAGQFDPAEQTLDADEVAVISDTGFYAGGLVTYVTPSSGQATNMQFYVRRVLPSGLSEVPLGGLASVAITGNENYGIYWMHNSFTNLVFNADALTPGQEITVGGADPTASPFDVKRIHLQNWGYNGTVVAGSEKSGQGTFQMNVTGFAGQVISSPITVYLGGGCDFRFGFGSFDNVTDNASIRVVGLLLNLNGQEVLVARHVDGFQFTDMTTAAWQ